MLNRVQLWTILLSATLLTSPFAYSTDLRQSHAQNSDWGVQTTEIWDQGDWNQFVETIEAAYLAGVPEEQIYWWVREQMEILATVEPTLQFDFPAPYSGWSDSDPGDPYTPPVEINSLANGKAGASLQNFPCNPSAPGGCTMPDVKNPGIVELPSDITLQTLSALGATISLAGFASGNVGVGIVGAAIVAVSENLQLWVLIEEEGDDEDEE